MERCRSKGEQRNKKAKHLNSGQEVSVVISEERLSMETYRTFSASPQDPNELLMYPILQGFSKEASNLATAANP